MKFTILKGMHYSLPFFIMPHFNVREAEFKIRFDDKCWYSKYKVKSTGINKLCGLGFGLNHHKNSLRIGWQPDFERKDIIKLYMYWYDAPHGDYNKRYLCSVVTGHDFKVVLNLTSGLYTATAYVPNPGGTGYTYSETVPNLYMDKSWGFWLRPYFGGASKAPHKMKIWVKKRKIK